MPTRIVSLIILIVSMSAILGACSNAAQEASNPRRTYDINVAMTGLQGELQITLQSGEDQDEITITENDLSSFQLELAAGDTYSIQVVQHPTGQRCSISNNSGEMPAQTLNLIAACFDDIKLKSIPYYNAAQLDWLPNGATDYDVYFAEEPLIEDNGNLINGTFYTTVSSEVNSVSVPNLVNGNSYYFAVKATYSGGHEVFFDPTFSQPNQVTVDRGFNFTQINSVARGEDGTIYIGGDFTGIGVSTGSGVPLNTQIPVIATPDYAKINGPVHAVVADGNNGWFVGGTFTRVNGQQQVYFAHILADGSLDTDWNLNITPQDTHGIKTLALHDGSLFIGGRFETGGNTSHLLAYNVENASPIAAWNHTFSKNTPVAVKSIAVDPDNGRVYVGGSFAFIDEQQHLNIAAFDQNGVLQNNWNVQAHYNTTLAPGDDTASVNSISLKGDRIYIGGSFYFINATNQALVAALDGNGTRLDWQAEMPSWFGQGTHVNKVLASPFRDRVYIGGFGAFANRYFEVVDENDGSTLPEDQWFANVNGIVHDIVETETAVYLAGGFRQTNNMDYQFLVRLSTDGNVMEDWKPLPGNQVFSLALQSDKLFVGGNFNSIYSHKRASLAAIDPDGVLSERWQPTTNGFIKVIKVDDTGVFVGGSFSQINDRSRNHIAKLDVSDGRVLTWGGNIPDSSTTAHVKDIEVVGNVVIAAGDFTATRGEEQWTGLMIFAGSTVVNPLAGYTVSRVNDLIYDGTNIYAAGWFTGGVADDHLIAFDPSGNLIEWSSGISLSEGMALELNDNTLYVASAQTADFTLDAVSLDTGQTIWPTIRADDTIFVLKKYNNLLFVGGEFSNLDDTPFLALGAINDAGAVVETGINLEPPPAAFRDVPPTHQIYVRSMYGDIDGLFVSGRFQKTGSVIERHLFVD